MNSKNHNRISRWTFSMIAKTLMAIALALTALSTTGITQTCIPWQSAPGKAYPLFEYQLANGGSLPQTFTYQMEEDIITMTIESSSSANLSPNEVRIVLTSAPNVTWRKEIVGWNSRSGQMESIVATQDGNHGPSSMDIFINDLSCESAGTISADTIVFKKAKFLGLMFDMYHLEIGNFWRILRGKIVTFNWVSDTNIQNPYPMPCASPCVPVGVTRRTTDIALTGPAGWNTLPIASSIGDGNFRVTNHLIGDFAGWASDPQAAKLSGDFNGDSWGDIALTGSSSWNSLPVAFSRHDGTFTVTNAFVGDFASWASTPEAVKLTGDFNGDGKTDIALTGPGWWNTLPVALSNGDGTFNITNLFVGSFASWAADPRAVKLTGDFNGDRKTDIALTGVPGWNTLPVAISNGDGTFNVTNLSVGAFATWAANPFASKLTGDFDGDGKTDIALPGGGPGQTLPVAFSRGDGTFNVTSPYVGVFQDMAANPRAAKLIGDFDGDGNTDIALAGGPWQTLPVAYSNGIGNFTVERRRHDAFALWASDPQSVKLAGDFDGDGKTDIALIGPGWWNTLPVAFSTNRGSFGITDKVVGVFESWASYPNAAKLTRDIN